MKDKLIKAIPTNIVTGFLGVGKTTAILNFLSRKPADERWAVLVNEFGEVGIDGSFYTGSASGKDGVHIREVPGGCMCCTSGVPMQIALNMLLAKAKPHRLLIEPSGLGHPKEVLQSLRSEYFQDVIELHNTIALVDARKITEPRYSQNQTYLQQLDIADIIVANKSELYSQDEFEELRQFLGQRYGERAKALLNVSQAKLPIRLLEGKSSVSVEGRAADSVAHHSKAFFPTDEPDFSESDYVSVKNSGEGFVSAGWIFKAELLFNELKLHSLLSGIEADRIKGVFLTSEGPVLFNAVEGVLSKSYLDEAYDSRIELIAKSEDIFASLETELLRCIP